MLNSVTFGGVLSIWSRGGNRIDTEFRGLLKGMNSNGTVRHGTLFAVMLSAWINVRMEFAVYAGDSKDLAFKEFYYLMNLLNCVMFRHCRV